MELKEIKEWAIQLQLDMQKETDWKWILHCTFNLIGELIDKLDTGVYGGDVDDDLLRSEDLHKEDYTISVKNDLKFFDPDAIEEALIWYAPTGTATPRVDAIIDALRMLTRSYQLLYERMDSRTIDLVLNGDDKNCHTQASLISTMVRKNYG